MAGRSVKRRYRVRANQRFQEIRRLGRSYSNEYLVLCILPNQLPYSRYGFSVSSRIGNAVTRNRIKRRLREAVRLRMDSIQPGWDLVFIARNPIRSADYHQMDAACARLLRRAHLLPDAPDTPADRSAAEQADERIGDETGPAGAEGV
ncbi:MAG: ribonuclease P protein component [Chloroflexi bacterium]|nr:MAG: ribonuclease P protein component [Chloroflexota bacterium]